jgi:hypothetical protein
MPVSGAVAVGGEWLSVPDAPFTRSQRVHVQFVPPNLLEPVKQYLLANEDQRDANGHLIGTPVNGGALWQLTAGAGPKTIYGQIEYSSGAWSEVITKSLTLATDKPSSLYIDLDPQSVSTVIRLTAPHRWHEFSTSATEDFEAWSPTRGTLGARNSFWAVYFDNLTGDLTPGTHALGPFDANTGDCLGYCADVVTTTSTRCGGTRSGSFTINSIEYYDSGDVRSADVDFRIICRVDLVMAGSLRYGLDDEVPALDQSADAFQFARQNVGTSSSEQKASFTNIGTGDVVLGSAVIGDFAVSSTPDDFEITTDTCSGETLEPTQACQVGVTFTPSSIASWSAVLHLPDNTARGGREVVMFASASQPTELTLDVSGSTTAPGPITFKVTLTPPAGDNRPRFLLENGPASHLIQWTVTDLPNPARRQWAATVNLTPGSYTASATFEASGYGSSSAEPVNIEMTGDGTPPVGQIIIENIYSGFTNDPSLRVKMPATDDDTGVARWGFQGFIDGGGTGWHYFDYDEDPPTMDWFVDPGKSFRIFATWQDGAGNWSDPITAEGAVDTTPPAVTAPRPAFALGSSITDGKVMVQVPLTAQDSLSGVADYDLNQKTDAGTWKNVPVATTGFSAVGASAVDRMLAPQHKYAFRVRATDVATNPSGWATGPAINIKRFQESSTRIRYSGTWYKVSNTSLWGGAARKSTKAGASATFSFTGRAFALVGRTGPGRGRARIYVNGSLVDTIDLYAASLTNRRVVWAGSWTNAVSRTIKVVVAGTAGRPLVELDALVTGE